MEAKAEILTIGDEILYGQIVDSNSQWLSGQLGMIGIKTVRKTTVGDNRDDILTAFQEAEERADLVIITGGLGPTKDDLTKPLLSEYFGSPLRMNEEALTEVREFFESRGIELSELNRKQAELPERCEKITNRFGTAPGMWFEKEGKVFISMPGVPIEMRTMVNEYVIPRLTDFFHTPVIYHKMIKTIGIGESFLSEKISQWEDDLPEHIKLAYLPTMNQVKLRLTAMGADVSDLEKQVAEQIEKLKPLAGKFIYGYDEEEIQGAVGKLLRQQGLTLSTAESCSGGYLAHLITSVPGSSDYYMGTIVSYSNQIKTDQLGVSEQTLRSHGAVSEETVCEMAVGVRQRLNTSIGLATTGIAGPDGGTEEKPVGTIWIAYADEDHTIARKLQLTNDRMLNIRITATACLNLLRIQIMKRINPA